MLRSMPISATLADPLASAVIVSTTTPAIASVALAFSSASDADSSARVSQLVYFISHNIARQEVVDNQICWVHRKGATRAFPAGYHALKDTPFKHTGHPIQLPGNPMAGSAVMVGTEGAAKRCYSINHGAGRAMGCKGAMRALDEKQIDESRREVQATSPSGSPRDAPNR